ncbi:MAG TPA: GAP family protein [Acidimicrobiia bacterium]|nr:GAP family protein [Acidimicrobiia bacterium]
MFALVAATSPLALASVLAVLTSGRGRLNGSAFAIGFVAGQAVFCALALALGAAASPDHEKRFPTFQSLLVIAFGAALLVVAAYVRRQAPPGDEPRPRSPRSQALHARLSSLGPGTALGTGLALGIGGPKRIAVTLVATATIAAAGLGPAQTTAVAVLYVAIATVLVWVPVLLYVVFGTRAGEWLTEGQRWASRHRETLTFYPSAVLGVVLVIDGIVQLAR